ncbi:MAG: GHKL domain-containing protein [Eubacteriales bacterium]|nr:GHKL domain-containing protein [Eubacteriales bacterium]
MQLYDILRSIVTNIMLVVLLFTLARPKCQMRTLYYALVAIVTTDFFLNIYFYLNNDYTTLGKLDIFFFIVVGISVKPLFSDRFMQWLFNCITAMNVYAVTVVLSYYLCGYFWYPQYANTILRFLMFAAVILLYRKYLRPLYRQAAELWSVYLFQSICMFTNLGWYFIGNNNVQQTLNENYIPILLLAALVVFVYVAIFISLKKSLRAATLREENLKMQSDSELIRQRLLLMDEAVRQMSIVQHDRRHFNNTLLALFQEGEYDKAKELILRQSEALPKKPQSYCRNVSVNAAVSYYAELARQQGIRCDLRLDIPENLKVDELSLVMAISNLLENAIAAVSVLTAEKRELRFTAVNTGQLILEMTNPYIGEIRLDEKGIPISSKEGHGRGTQSISAFIAGCGGELVYDVSGGIFKVRLMA